MTSAVNETKGSIPAGGSSFSRFSFERLGEEPRQLHNQVLQLDNEINELSVQNYEVHISNSQCLDGLATGSDSVAHSTDELLEELPRLRTDIDAFAQVGRKLCDAHKRNRVTISNANQIVELLEIPQLMDTCVRNGLYTEALELRSFASTLLLHHEAIYSGLQKGNKVNNEGKYEEPVKGSGIEIIKTIMDEVKTVESKMRFYLIEKLKAKTNLIEALKIVSHLKKVSARNGQDGNIKSLFLQCKNVYLKAETSVKSDPYNAIVNIIKKNRENWFDIITQYKTIFAETNDKSSKDNKVVDDGILSKWICERIEAFLKRLNHYIVEIDDITNITNVFKDACMLARSLGRVRADFTQLLIPLFLDRICSVIDEYWDGAFKQSCNSLESGEWGLPLPIPTQKSDSDAKMMEFLSFPVVASLVNALLISFNELRNCASPLLGIRLGAILETYLEKIPKSLQSYRDSRPEQVFMERQARYEQLEQILKINFRIFVEETFNKLFDTKILDIAPEDYLKKHDVSGQLSKTETEMNSEEKLENEPDGNSQREHSSEKEDAPIEDLQTGEVVESAEKVLVESMGEIGAEDTNHRAEDTA
mmetsp:Transcript_10053/g.13161  ORF Transcript_10053/g.13161 Transcript_10053/m.13161 type:complete len:590 (+) Transcript_10053:320-2089(+)